MYANNNPPLPWLHKTDELSFVEFGFLFFEAVKTKEH